MKLALYTVLVSSYINPNYQLGGYLVQVTSLKNISNIWQVAQFLKNIENSQK